MTLADLFSVLNDAGIRVRAEGGQIKLDAPPGVITDDLCRAVAEHKPALLAMLPGTADEEREAIQAVEENPPPPHELARHAEEFDRLAFQDGFRNSHDWRDWRLEWMLEVGRLYLQARNAGEPVRGRLLALADETPATVDQWVLLGRRIAALEFELRQAGELPALPWPRLAGEAEEVF